MNKSQGSLYEHKTSLKQILATALPLHGARLTCLSMLLLALVQEKTVNLVSLSLAFQGTMLPESSYRRIRRFFGEVRLDKRKLSVLLLSFLPAPPYTVCVDRTNWQFGKVDINILVIGIAHRGVAFPVVWRLLPKAGNSSSDERIDLLQAFLDLVKPEDIKFFLADREFIGATWFNYLDKRRVPFAIRIRNTSLCDGWCPIYGLFRHLPEGELKVLSKHHGIYGTQVRLVGMKLTKGYAILATNRSPQAAFLAYQERWSIEMLFSALKKSGFDIEATHLTHLARLDTLFAVLAIAFAWAHHVGEWLHDSKLKPLKRKSHLRRAKSFFRHGLDHLRHLLNNLFFMSDDLLVCIQLLSCT